MPKQLINGEICHWNHVSPLTSFKVNYNLTCTIRDGGLYGLKFKRRLNNGQIEAVPVEVELTFTSSEAIGMFVHAFNLYSIFGEDLINQVYTFLMQIFGEDKIKEFREAAIGRSYYSPDYSMDSLVEREIESRGLNLENKCYSNFTLEMNFRH